MAIKLFEHNQQAYKAAVAMLAETGKAAIVHPTGTGKSFIGFKLCEENPDKMILWLSPSENIFKTQLENLSAVSGGWTPDNITYITFARLTFMTDAEIEALAVDEIVIDEFHRVGAEVWGQSVNRVLSAFPNVPVLGLSATAIRYLDNQRDMAEELFDGNIASEMTLGEAIVRGILNPPKYILSIYSYSKDLEKYEKRIRSAKSKAVRDEASAYLEALRRALENAEGLDVIFDKHMTNRHGKYIIFTPNYESMQEYMELADEWFGKIDKDAHIYSVYSDDSSASKSFCDFKEDNSDHLRLLYCIDALNEGVHVEDISGVILLRPTVSPVIYKQQIGRALSASKSCEPIIFDIVNNIENLYSIDSVKEEMRNAIVYYRSHGDSNFVVNDTFEIIDKLAKCKDLFDKLEESLTATWDVMYAAAEKYYRTMGSLEPPQRFITEEGYALGAWLGTQRRVRSGKISGILTDEQIEKLDRIGMRWDSVKDIAWNKYYSAALDYYNTHHSLNVNSRFVTEDGVRLGAWISQLRVYRKNGLKSSYLTSERIVMLDKLGMLWDVYDYLFEQNYHAAVEYYHEHGDLECGNRYITEDGIRLGAWLEYLRTQCKKNRNFLTDDKYRMLNAIGMRWGNKYDLQWNKSYGELYEYYRLNGHIKVPTAYTTENGLHLGRWVSKQIELYSKNQLRADRIEKLENLGIVWNTGDSWEEKFQLVKEYSEKHHGVLSIPADYVVNGIWLNKWLNEQKLMGEGKRKKQLTPEQREKLESIGLVFGKTNSDIAWSKRYMEAKKFYDSHGNLNVPVGYKDDLGKNLYIWIMKQVEFYRDGKLSDEQIRKLTEIGMVFESKDSFEKGYIHAKVYYDTHGDIAVPGSYVCEDGFKLSQWLNNRRAQKSCLTVQQVSLLDDLGMVWDINADRWYQMYQSALMFYRQNGHMKVPAKYKTENGKNLYDWLQRQRKKYNIGKLSEDKVILLRQIGFDFGNDSDLEIQRNDKKLIDDIRKHA